MKKTKNNILTVLSSLSALAALAPITGNDYWLSFLSFLPFLAFARMKKDERYAQIRDRAARNGFIASLLCIIGLVLVIITHPNYNTIIYTIQAQLWIVAITFTISYKIYDKRGY